MAKRSRSSIQDNLLVATESTRGLKATNEDRACSVRVERVGMCFGVYDGHGGTEAADFTTANLIRNICLLYTSPSPRDGLLSRMPSSA